MSQDYDLDGLPSRMRDEIESFIDRVSKTVVNDVNLALSTAGLAATVTSTRDGRHVDLVISASQKDRRRAEDIADAVLQSVLIKMSGNQHLLH